MTENWLPIKGYEGLYEVSSEGRVRSLDAIVPNRSAKGRLRRGRVLKPTPYRGGYLQIPLSKSGQKLRHWKVHRLVAFAFLGMPPDDEAHVNHKDFDKTNNRLSNLEWTTAKENRRHAVDAGRFDGSISPKRGKKLNVEAVRNIRTAIARGETQRKVAAEHNICTRTLRRIMTGKIWVKAA